MLGKKSNPAENLAQTVLESVNEVFNAYRDMSSFDKTFFCNILGVNQKFVDGVSSADRTELINKFSIPETVEEGEENYYTVKLNGVYYVTRSPHYFLLYEEVNVRVPNGSWDNLYIEGKIPDNTVIEMPEMFVSVTAPEDTEEQPVKEGDCWVKVNNLTDKDIQGFYVYENVGTVESPVYSWSLLFNVDNEQTTQRKIYVQSNTPTGASKGDIWLKTATRYHNYDTKITNIYEYNTSWILKGTFNNTGISLDNGNEIFCDYENSYIVNSEHSVCFGKYVQLYNSACTMIGGNNSSGGLSIAYNAESSIVWGKGIDIGRNSNDDEVVSSLVIGETLKSKGKTNYSFVGGNAHDFKNVISSVVTGFFHHIGNYNETIQDKTGGIYCSIVAGELNSVACVKDGIICGSGQVVNPEYDYDSSISSVRHGLIMGGYSGICSSSSQLLIIGNGKKTTNNALTLYDSGDLYIQGTLYQNSADYAETYEWLDGNPQAEKRTGLFVTLDGEKIILADSDSDYILGVVSATPTVCGDTYDSYWHGKFERDVFGQILKDKNGDMIVSEKYDPGREYIPQSKRPEKAAVGTHGKLVVVDDGTCKVNGYCRPTKGGIATASAEKTDYRVIERRDENHVRIVIK